MKEEWVLIKQLDKPYYVSNLGNIKNSDGLIMKQRQDKHGYKRISFTYSINKQRVTKTLFIHRLVAEHFLSNENNYSQVTFKNHCKEDVCAENLQWCEKAISTTRICKNKGNKVICIDTNEVFKNIATAAKECNISVGSIYNCCTGKVKTAGGYRWKYIRK